MKTRNLLIVAFFVPTLFCHAQDKEPAGKPAQVAAPAPAGLASAAGTASDSYVIGASDVLTITVWKEPTLSGSLLGLTAWSRCRFWAMFRPLA
jgi:protein involved in polysaccharide export with SLBB domain